MYKKTLTKTEEGRVYREITEYYYSGGTLREGQVSPNIRTAILPTKVAECGSCTMRLGI